MDYSIEYKSKLKSKFSHIKSLCEKMGAVDLLNDINQLELMVLTTAEDKSLPVSVQLSIYPLRQPSLSRTINKSIKILQEHGLKLIPGSMSTLILGEADQVWSALARAFSEASALSEVVMIVTASNACPKPDEAEENQ